MFRFVSCLVLVAVATAAYLPAGHRRISGPKYATRKIYHHAPVEEDVKSEPEHHHHSHQSTEEHDHFVDYYAPINYKFEYGVKDPHTGDHKTHWEEREGDVVRGAYTILDADGSSRLVEYTADPHHGFNAVVKKIEHPHVQVQEHQEHEEHQAHQPEQQQQHDHYSHHHHHHEADEHVPQQKHHHHEHMVHEHHGYGHGHGASY